MTAHDHDDERQTVNRPNPFRDPAGWHASFERDALAALDLDAEEETPARDDLAARRAARKAARERDDDR